MGKKWVPLESNPDVLNEFAAKLGLDTSLFRFADVFGLDEELLAFVPQPTIAVVLLFPVGPEEEGFDRNAGITDSEEAYFMRQTIGNACGTIAVLHSIENNLDKVGVAPESFLDKFYAATAGMSPQERGKYLEDPPEGAPDIEVAHQEAAASGDTRAPSAEDDVNLHFIAFVERNGTLYELDGRRNGPISHGPTTATTLLKDSAIVIKNFIERTKSHQFNVIALAGSQ